MLPPSVDYETRYEKESEPWRYSERAAELLRHEYIAAKIRTLQPRSRILDVGCSIGQLTRKLKTVASVVVGMDVSHTALVKARTNCQSEHMLGPTRYLFAVGQASALPFRAAMFDVVISADVLLEGGFSEELKGQAIEEYARVLRPGGRAIFTDYMRSTGFDGYIALVKQSRLKIVSIEYLSDRLWYQFESLFHLFQNSFWVKALLRNLFLAQIFQRISRTLGRKYSKHICIVAEKPVENNPPIIRTSFPERDSRCP
jgi:ubiquinone/menaquinone biosynthesis C-methylase UbiE